MYTYLKVREKLYVPLHLGYYPKFFKLVLCDLSETVEHFCFNNITNKHNAAVIIIIVQYRR